MLPIILSNGQGIDSENLDLFKNEKIGGLSLTERILLILASEGFSNAGLIADIPEIRFKRLNKKYPEFKIHQSKNISDFVNKEDILIFQNNVVINKKQTQSSLQIIKNQ